MNSLKVNSKVTNTKIIQLRRRNKKDHKNNE